MFYVVVLFSFLLLEKILDLIKLRFEDGKTISTQTRSGWFTYVYILKVMSQEKQTNSV